MPKIERKTFDAAEFKAIDDATGTAQMIVSVFNNVDSARERILPGFFSESLATRRNAHGAPRVKGVWSHNWDVPIGKTLDAVELMPGDPRLPAQLKDLGGLWIKGQFNLDTQRGREAYSDLKFGSIDEFSIGYSVQEDDVDQKTGIRDLVRGQLYEWSPVLVGANPATTLLSVKSLDSDAFGRAFAAALATDGSLEDQVKAAIEALALSSDPDPADLPEPVDESTDDAENADPLELPKTATFDRVAFLADFELEVKEGRTFSAANLTRMGTIADDLEASAVRLRELIATSVAKDGSRAPLAILQLRSAFMERDHYYDRLLGGVK
jgi:uncharacterized protein